MKPNVKTEELTEMIRAGVKSLTEGESYQKYLKTMAKFSTYSVRNVMLIFTQCPDASFVAGYQAWKTKFGRQVKKGEKAIRIFAPYQRTFTNEDGEMETKLSYRTVSVFDISQTTGKPMPTLPNIEKLEGQVEGYDDLLKALMLISPFEVEFMALSDETNGSTCYAESLIKIDDGMSQAQTIKTLIHEIAHSILHNREQIIEDPYTMEVLSDSSLREMEAESVAFVVSSKLGLDTSSYSFEYVCRWAQGRDFPEQMLQRISKTADKIISGLERYFETNLPA